ncbi:hypothetical protein ACFSCX_10550 [Bacillus salitolerans]|uniref:Uncharacterized protein n=1 Tax=Bacillus salitolerans TaxID=1437434 RepID=A0ABW4LPH4_9BACI
MQKPSDYYYYIKRVDIQDYIFAGIWFSTLVESEMWSDFEDFRHCPLHL